MLVRRDTYDQVLGNQKDRPGRNGIRVPDQWFAEGSPRGFPEAISWLLRSIASLGQGQDQCQPCLVAEALNDAALPHGGGPAGRQPGGAGSATFPLRGRARQWLAVP